MITKEHFGTLPDGQEVERYTLTNQQGVRVDILTLGAIIQRWTLPAPHNRDIVLGFDDLAGYLDDDSYIGATVGRYANRIGKGKFTLGGEQYNVSVNLQGNTLHGGENGFDSRVWQATASSEGDNPAVVLTLISEDGDQGFPGTLKASAEFTLTEDNCLRIRYQGESDRDTVFNPTQHSYFNLAGQDSGHVGEHMLQVSADSFTPADETGIPTGEIEDVSGTDFDLRKAHSISELLLREDARLKFTNGLDHNWCLGDNPNNTLRSVAKVTEPESGLAMEVKTTMPGMQVYTANFIAEGKRGKAGASYGPYHAFCLETQFYPDAPNKPHFPCATLKKGEQFKSVTEYWVSL